ncbi:hypothetical protein FCL47_13120 [Desulfopila sp. IMCC35006]|uniref:hypothetical protein n=1 Tax=Desulfopila sp. IMCC35006 TaxID=2569542 RepID=UPI0010AD33F8|nr:hypothetical protein [Desulfopila sp. IMCC35006]TKB25481.1 hypothetical protein FCL47_13120 [Desulfopila sp. IMCC35006]
MKKVTLIAFGVTSLQVTLLVILVVLEYLSSYKAGLAQHLYFKKISYVTHFYQGAPLFLHGVLLLILTVMAVKGSSRHGKTIIPNFYKYFILLTAFVICFLSAFTRGLNIYAHLLITLQLCMVLEVAGLMIRRPPS